LVMALAPVLAPIAGGLVQTGFGWRATFLTLVIVGLLGGVIVLLLLPETINARAAEPVSMRSIFRSYRVVARDPSYLAYLGIASTSYAGLFAWISGAAFVLQNLYGLTPFDFGVAFALGSIGYMTGSALAARMVVKVGLDGMLGIGGCACAAGGLGMVMAVAFGLTSFLSLVLPVAVYLAGLGMVLPQGIAGAMTPFPERAGAASSLFGFVQQIAAALCGAAVGWFLGKSAWPLAVGVAAMGCATLGLWLATRGIRRAAAKH
jgi:MFS transporter, DHA1 family, multidrug resistance protein